MVALHADAMFRQGQSAPITPHETRLRPGIAFPTGRRAAISDLDQACAPETGVQRNRSCLVGHPDDQGSGGAGQHPSGAHHAGGDRTGTAGGGETECPGIGAAAGQRAPAEEEIQSGDGEVARHADGFAGVGLDGSTSLEARASGEWCGHGAFGPCLRLLAVDAVDGVLRE